MEQELNNWELIDTEYLQLSENPYITVEKIIELLNKGEYLSNNLIIIEKESEANSKLFINLSSLPPTIINKKIKIKRKNKTKQQKQEKLTINDNEKRNLISKLSKIKHKKRVSLININ